MSVANIGKFQEKFAAVQDRYEISQHEGHHFAAREIGIQLVVIGFQWLEFLHFNFESCTILSVGLLTSQASKRHIVCII